MEPSIHLAPRAEDNGYAVMVAQLLRQGLDERPEKKATVAKMHGRVTLVVTDLGLTVSLVFDDPDPPPIVMELALSPY